MKKRIEFLKEVKTPEQFVDKLVEFGFFEEFQIEIEPVEFCIFLQTKITSNPVIDSKIQSLGLMAKKIKDLAPIEILTPQLLKVITKLSIDNDIDTVNPKFFETLTKEMKKDNDIFFDKSVSKLIGKNLVELNSDDKVDLGVVYAQYEACNLTSNSTFYEYICSTTTATKFTTNFSNVIYYCTEKQVELKALNKFLSITEKEEIDIKLELMSDGEKELYFENLNKELSSILQTFLEEPNGKEAIILLAAGVDKIDELPASELDKILILQNRLIDNELQIMNPQLERVIYESIKANEKKQEIYNHDRKLS